MKPLILNLKLKINTLFGGLALVIIIAMSANFLSLHYKVPVMLFALLIGLAFHFLNEEINCIDGINFASGTLLKLGVGLLGLKLTLTNIESVGFYPILSVFIMVILTLFCGAILSFIFGRRLAFGLLAGGSVAICGASAALAIASVLPPKKDREKDVLFVVISITVLSTIAMILYPILFIKLGMNDNESGFLIGATIHDVAQVIGAGYSISEEAGIIATFIKMLRVSLLPLVVIIVMLSFRGAQTQKVNIPWFLILFILLAIINNIVQIPEIVSNPINLLSQWLLIIAISAIGVKSNLAQITKVRSGYAIIIIVETLFLLGIAIFYIKYFS